MFWFRNFPRAKALVKLQNQNIVHYQITFLGPLLGLDNILLQNYLVSVYWTMNKKTKQNKSRVPRPL